MEFSVMDYDKILEFMTSMSPALDRIVAILSHQITLTGLAFTFAAWVHSGRVKKGIDEFKGEFISAMTTSLDKVAKSLKDDLDAQREFISKLNAGVAELKTEVLEVKTRVSALEKGEQKWPIKN